MLLVLLLTALLLPASAGAHAGPAGWRWPADGPVLSPFVTAASPFAAGQHRGIDIGARPGAAVRSACTGEVSFAGVAGPSGRTVTVACGGLLTTYLHLSSIAVHRRDAVAAGARLGRVGTSGSPRDPRPHLHFGVRRAGVRWAYLDPLTLLPARGPAGGRPVLGPAPRGSRRPLPPPAAPARPRARSRPAAEPRHAPLVAWAALAAGVCALPAWGLGVRRRRARGRAWPARPPGEVHQ